MSDEKHVEPELPTSGELANRLFAISMAGVLSFIAVVFAFIIL
jgi:hypothetical protein